MLSVVAMAADLKTGVTYKGTWADIENTVNTADNSTVTEIYTLGGARVNSLQKGINIVRLANGKTVKVIK